MAPPLRSLAVSLVAVGIGLGAVDRAYDRYADHHFVPEQRFAAAVAMRDGCVLALGDSRMEAGVVADEVQRGLAEGGAPGCALSLAIGAVDVPGAFLALRRYLDAGRTPKEVVLGVGTTLPRPITEPSQMIGNASILLRWSHADDVFLFYPGFPFADLDRGLRFSIDRTSALGSTASLLWFRVQAAQARLTGDPAAGPRNRFGLVEDMEALGRSFAAADSAMLHDWDGRFRSDPWVQRIRDAVHARGTRFAIVLVPMPRLYREQVSDSPEGRRYVQWLEGDTAGRGDALVNLRDLMPDDQFGDGVHLSGAAPAAFSQALGRALAAR